MSLLVFAITKYLRQASRTKKRGLFELVVLEGPRDRDLSDDGLLAGNVPKQRKSHSKRQGMCTGALSVLVPT